MEIFTSCVLPSDWQIIATQLSTHTHTQSRIILQIHYAPMTPRNKRQPHILHFSHNPHVKRHCTLCWVGKVCNALKFMVHCTPYVSTDSTGRCLLHDFMKYRMDGCIVGWCWMAQHSSAKIEIWKVSLSSCDLSWSSTQSCELPPPPGRSIQKDCRSARSPWSWECGGSWRKMTPFFFASSSSSSVKQKNTQRLWSLPMLEEKWREWNQPQAGNKAERNTLRTPFHIYLLCSLDAIHPFWCLV